MLFFKVTSINRLLLLSPSKNQNTIKVKITKITVGSRKNNMFYSRVGGGVGGAGAGAGAGQKCSSGFILIRALGGSCNPGFNILL